MILSSSGKILILMGQIQVHTHFRKKVQNIISDEKVSFERVYMNSFLLIKMKITQKSR